MKGKFMINWRVIAVLVLAAAVAGCKMPATNSVRYGEYTIHRDGSYSRRLSYTIAKQTVGGSYTGRWTLVGPGDGPNPSFSILLDNGTLIPVNRIPGGKALLEGNEGKADPETAPANSN